MFCVQCGTENRDTDSYCRSCGAQLKVPGDFVTPEEVAAAGAAAAGAAAAGAAGQPFDARAPQQAYQPNYQQGYQGYQQQPPYQPPQYSAYQPTPVPEGVLGAAWRDITGTVGWLKKVIVLCLLGCVPILNLGVEGYALRWGRGLMFGNREAMPKEVFKKKEILTGFRALLIRIVYDSVFVILGFLAIILLGAIFGLFGPAAAEVVSLLAIFALCIGYAFFYYPIENVAIARLVSVDYLEGGLNVQKIWGAFRRSMGGAIAGSVVPPLAVGIVQAILMSLVTAIIMGVAAASLGDMVNTYGGMYDSYDMNILFMYDDLLDTLTYLGAGFVFLYTLACIVCAMLSVFGMLIRWRAIFHWTARTVPEWKDESDEETIAAMAAEKMAQNE